MGNMNLVNGITRGNIPPRVNKMVMNKSATATSGNTDKASMKVSSSKRMNVIYDTTKSNTLGG